MRSQGFKSLAGKGALPRRHVQSRIFFFFFKMRHLGACLGTDENYPVGRIIRGQPLIRRKARPAHLETHGARGQCRDQSSPGGHAPCPLLSVLPQLNILQTGRWLFNRKLAAVT